MLYLLQVLINIILTVIEFLLSVRFILLFFDASAKSTFVAWIYKTSASLVVPFASIAPPIKIGGFVIDITTLITLLVYGIIGGLVIRLISYIRSGF